MTNYDQMSDFVDMNELPLVIDYADKVVCANQSNDHFQTTREIFDSKVIKNQVVLFYNRQDSDYEDYLNEFFSLSKELLGDSYCVKAEIQTSKRLLYHLGVYDEVHHGFIIHVSLIPAVDVQNNKEGAGISRKYLFEGEMVVEEMHSFVNKAMRRDKSLKRIYVSERIDPAEKRIGHQVY